MTGISTYNPNINPTPSSFPYYSKSQDDPNFDRDEILKQSVKGYREYTYWGKEHPIQEQTKNLSDEEFNRYVKDEIED